MTLSAIITNFDPTTAVGALKVFVGLGAVANTLLQIVRSLPRYFQYRLIRKFFRFRDGQRVLVVCSELENALARQWVEPHEFSYMLKYGDLDALFEIASLIREVYPKCRLKILSSHEAEFGNIDLGCDIIVIGGPDYNYVCRQLLTEAKSLIGYAELECPDDQSPIALKAQSQSWRGEDQTQDYGYIEVLENPFARKSKVFFFGGCHTIGVTGAVKALQLRREDEPGLTAQAADNISRMLRFARFRTHFAAVFRVALMGATIPPPSLQSANFLGSPRRFMGVEIEWLFHFGSRLRPKA
jgi:hypothetical protein